jgi:CHAP domain-containing protein
MNHIQIAITQIGKEEIPRGSNWGEHVQKYLKSVGLSFPASWCMAFIYWCAKEAKPVNPLIKTGGVLRQWREVDVKYKFKDPKPGDIFIQDHGHGLGHTGFVESVQGEMIHTIEGNTNDTGSREGYQVCRRERKINSCIGFIRI